MAEIDPSAQAQQYTPRQSSIVDAIAETKRIADATLRSNPLQNARVDTGLMRWKGNYGLDVDASYLWIGEFWPPDAVLNKPQRGFILSRDDPKRKAALWVYDSNAGQTGPTVPLRQTITMSDADGYPLLVEGRAGGAQFPWMPVPMVFAESTRVGVDTYRMGPNSLPAGSTRSIYSGYAPMVGTRVRTRLFCTSTGGQTFNAQLQFVWDDSSTYTTSLTSVTTSGYFNWDIDFAGQGKIGMGVTISVIAGLNSGNATDGTWLYHDYTSIYSS